jgi:hypothetical protein
MVVLIMYLIMWFVVLIDARLRAQCARESQRGYDSSPAKWWISRNMMLTAHPRPSHARVGAVTW